MYVSIHKRPRLLKRIVHSSSIIKKKKKSIDVIIVFINMLVFLEETKSIGMEYLSLGDKLVEDGCIHIISLGSKALMMQIWADMNTGAFIFRYGALVQKLSCKHM